MPLGKYYCDYCEKQFQDTPSARKRHLQGATHLRARALWFDSLKVAETTHGSASLPLLRRPPDGTFAAAAAAAQGVCRHFVRTGVCRYGDSCKYYHPKPEFVNQAAAAAAAAATAASGLGVAEGVQAPNFFGNPLTGGSSFSGEMARDKMALWGHLPPSLQPPPDGGYPPLPFVDWG
ncbi:zinc finger CCCH domain-containing protein 3 isoform X2 [Ananas comosus]|uniref:Zinc finger CCCH domain-containing protein 3 isoform X2 n=1 Tax=Ananas comosus TaxID=4615 RepID=A0A6P5G1R0_ANACO|nr:zinc finger CCCH domain-containing protein 3 isoform X2 [Ananas comosus]